MGRVLFGVIRIHQDVVQLHDYRDVNHIGEDIIHEPLESGRGVHEPFGHHEPLERPVLGPERGFPFVAIGDMDEVISVSQVNLGIDSHLVGCV